MCLNLKPRPKKWLISSVSSSYHWTLSDTWFYDSQNFGKTISAQMIEQFTYAKARP